MKIWLIGRFPKPRRWRQPGMHIEFGDLMDCGLVCLRSSCQGFTASVSSQYSREHW